MAKKRFAEKAKKMARESIYDGAKYIGTWHGYEVFEPTFNDTDGEPPCIGIPQFILIKDGEARWTRTEEESFSIIDAIDTRDQ